MAVFVLGLGVFAGNNSVVAYSISKVDSITILNYLKSPKNYIEYLVNYDENEALRLGIDKNNVDEAINGAKANLEEEEFKKLSYKNQQLYLKYISNPDKLIKDTIEGNDSNLQLVESDKISKDESQIGISASFRTVKHTGSLKVLGITWTKYAIEGKY